MLVSLAYIYAREALMERNLDRLLEERARILRAICELGDFRPGSITTTTGRCGTRTCHCHRPNDRGHGPTYRLTRKVNGKTVTETFSDKAALDKAQGEIAEFHKFRELCGRLTEVNEQICRSREVEEGRRGGRDWEKKRRKRSWRKSAEK